MSLEYKSSVRLYWLAKRTAAPNREFNVESQRQSVHDKYHDCLKILNIYSRSHKEDPVVAYSIWGGRKRLGLKFQDRNLTICVVKDGDIPVGTPREIKSPFELKRYLENTMGFIVSNLNEEMFEKAYLRLKKIEKDKKIIIDFDEAKSW
jgi:hypothetical protein